MGPEMDHPTGIDFNPLAPRRSQTQSGSSSLPVGDISIRWLRGGARRTHPLIRSVCGVFQSAGSAEEPDVFRGYLLHDRGDFNPLAPRRSQTSMPDNLPNTLARFQSAGSAEEPD